jgi:hypothetical protein
MTLQLIRDERMPYGEFVQPVGTKIAYGVEWADRLAQLWMRSTQFAQGVAVRSLKHPAFQYVSSGGQSDASEPDFAQVVGGTVADGPITWTTMALDDSSLRATISGSVWTPDVGIVVTGQSISGTRTAALVDTTGAAEGTDLYVRNAVTLSDGEVEEAVFLIRVRSGRT